MNRSLLTSGNAEWETPQFLFDDLNRIYHFTLDACATFENAKCAQFFTATDDALSKPWHGSVFINPPYGHTIGKWVKKAYQEVMDGRADVVVALLPARVDTTWFHDYCTRGYVTFLRLRVRFSGSSINAPFPTMIVVFTRPLTSRPPKGESSKKH